MQVLQRASYSGDAGGTAECLQQSRRNFPSCHAHSAVPNFIQLHKRAAAAAAVSGVGGKGCGQCRSERHIAVMEQSLCMDHLCAAIWCFLAL